MVLKSHNNHPGIDFASGRLVEAVGDRKLTGKAHHVHLS